MSSSASLYNFINPVVSVLEKVNFSIMDGIGIGWVAPHMHGPHWVLRHWTGQCRDDEYDCNWQHHNNEIPIFTTRLGAGNCSWKCDSNLFSYVHRLHFSSSV